MLLQQKSSTKLNIVKIEQTSDSQKNVKLPVQEVSLKIYLISKSYNSLMHLTDSNYYVLSIKYQILKTSIK